MRTGPLAAAGLAAAAALASSRGTDPPHVAPAVLSPATAVRCAAVLARLPATLAGAARVATLPASPYVVAWGDPPAVVRCLPPGPPPPSDLVLPVDGVEWFRDPLDPEVLRSRTAVPLEVQLPRGAMALFPPAALGAATDALLAGPAA